MNQEVLKHFKKHLESILKFVENPSEKNTYKYHNLVTDEKIEFKDLKGFPCTFFLFLSNKHLCRKYEKDGKSFTDKSCLDYELDNYIKDITIGWEGFTGDYLHPVPNRPYVDLSIYNSGLVHQHRKSEGTLWMKEMGIMQISYLKYLLSNIEVE